MIRTLAKILSPVLKVFAFLTPIGDMLARVWVAQIFFVAGLTKIQTWSSTLYLFRYEYTVPLLTPEVAAIIGTGAELILPVLLVLGLGGRITTFIFFMYNLIAVISYPFLWTDQGVHGLYQHINWGLLLMLLMFHGSGKLSLDHWIKRKYGHMMETS